MPTLTNETIGAILPPQEPPLILAGGVSERDFELALERRQSERDRRILRWTTFFQAVTERMRPDQQFSGFQYITYGFIPVSRDISDQAGGYGQYVFGAAIELEPNTGHPAQRMIEIDFEGIKFPIVFNRRKINLNYPDISTSTRFGTSTCWARSQKVLTPLSSEGLLTAAHVVQDVTLGAAVNCSLGGSWLLADRGGCKIDIALVVQNGCIPTDAPILDVDRHPKEGSAVSFFSVATARPIRGSITHSFVHPSTLCTRHPMRVFMDAYGLPGDSGALVENVEDGMGVGVYMGCNPLDGMNQFEGVAQALCQGVYVLNAQLFRIGEEDER